MRLQPLRHPYSPRVVYPVIKVEKTKIVRQYPILEFQLKFILIEPIDRVGLWAPLPLFVFHITFHNL